MRWTDIIPESVWDEERGVDYTGLAAPADEFTIRVSGDIWSVELRFNDGDTVERLSADGWNLDPDFQKSKRRALAALDALMAIYVEAP